MSRGLNKIQVIGRLGRDPEMRYTPDGKAVTNFTVATGGKWTDRGGTERDDTEWFRVEVWDRQAETANQYLAKGAQVFIEGRLKTRKYTDKDGIERTSVEVVANNMVLLGSNTRGGGNDGGDYDQGYGDEEGAPAQPARPAAARPAAAPRDAAPSRPPAQNRAPAPAPAARPNGRNQPQPFDEEDLPF